MFKYIGSFCFVVTSIDVALHDEIFEVETSGSFDVCTSFEEVFADESPVVSVADKFCGCLADEAFVFVAPEVEG